MSIKNLKFAKDTKQKNIQELKDKIFNKLHNLESKNLSMPDHKQNLKQIDNSVCELTNEIKLIKKKNQELLNQQNLTLIGMQNQKSDLELMKKDIRSSKSRSVSNPNIHQSHYYMVNFML